MNGGPKMELKLTAPLNSQQREPIAVHKSGIIHQESPLSSYGESFQADSPDPKDYFGRWDSRSPSPVYQYRTRPTRSPPKRGVGYNEYLNYDYTREAGRPEKRRARDSGFYGGSADRAAVRRKEREERDNMVRNYIRNGRGWSQPNVAGDRTRKLPKTPANSLNAMGVLQSMLGLNQTPMGSINTLNGSVPSLNYTLGVASNMVNAVRRLPQVPLGEAPPQGGTGLFSKLFGKKEATTPLMPQQPPGLGHPVLTANQHSLQNLHTLTANPNLTQQPGMLNQLGMQQQGMMNQQLPLHQQQQQQQSLINQQLSLQQPQLLVPQQMVGNPMFNQQQQQQQINESQLLQQQMMMQQNMMQGGSISSIPAMLVASSTLPTNLPQSILLQPLPPAGHQLHPLPPAGHQLHPLLNQPLLQGEPLTSYPSTGLPQFPASILSQTVQQLQPNKKPGEGWGGRGARLPKIPIPLPSKHPKKNRTLVGGPFSRSLEEVEEDLFLERVVTVGRGSRRLPTPGGSTIRSRTRLTRQNGTGQPFRRGFSLDSDEFDAESRDSIWP